MTKRLGELLIKANLVTPEQVKKALDEQKVTGGSIGTNLIKLGYIDEENLLAFLSKFYHVEPVKLSKIHIDQKVLGLVPSGTAKKHLVIPIKRVGPKLILAMSDPSNIMVIDEIKFITGYNVQPVVAIDMDLVVGQAWISIPADRHHPPTAPMAASSCRVRKTAPGSRAVTPLARRDATTLSSGSKSQRQMADRILLSFRTVPCPVLTARPAQDLTRMPQEWRPL